MSDNPDWQSWRPPADSRGWIIRNLNIALIVVTSVIVIARLNIRGFMLRALGMDDLIAAIAYVLVIIMSTFEIKAASHGSGTHLTEVPFRQIAMFFANLVTLQLLFFMSIAMVRFSVIAFQLKLSRERWFRLSLYCVAFVNLTITMIAFFYFLTECRPIGDLWNVTAPNRNCLPKSQEKLVFWSHGIVGICIDCALLVLPIWIISVKMKFSAKMAQVILVFCLGILAVVVGIIRVYYSITSDFQEDSTYKMILVAPWTDLECHLGLWIASFPAFQPLIRLVRHKLGFGSRSYSREQKTSGRGGYDSQRRIRKSTTTTAANSWTDPWTGSQASRATRATRHTQESMVFEDRPVDGGGLSVVCKRSSNPPMDAEGLELSGMEGLRGIRKETRVSVHVAETDPSRPQSRETTDGESAPGHWDAV